MAEKAYWRTSSAESVAITSATTASLEARIDPHWAAAIIQVARELARTVPPPRGAPYFFLDTAAAYDLRVLDAVCSRGIFRKYEFALDIGSGLGGRARWLAARSGCRIVGIDPRPAAVSIANLLNRRARMDEQVKFQVGSPEWLPLRERVFTHVWWLDAVASAAATATVSEAFRVLRRGGHFALQSACDAAAGSNAWPQLLRAVGFIEIVTCDVQLTEPPHVMRLAQERLRTEIQRTAKGLPSPIPDWQTSSQTRLQIFARRPA